MEAPTALSSYRHDPIGHSMRLKDVPFQQANSPNGPQAGSPSGIPIAVGIRLGQRGNQLAKQPRQRLLLAPRQAGQ